MFSVIIPTCNAGDGFSKVLDALDAQTLKAKEILIIDSASSDSTTKIAQNHNCKVVQIGKHNFDHGTTRNAAVAQTDSEFVVFLTQDAVPANKYMVAELIKPMQADSNIAICYGRHVPLPNTGALEHFYQDFNYPQQSILKTKNHIDTLGLKTFFCSNCCSAIRCSIFNELDGFKNKVIVNEDMLFAAKAIMAGYAVYYAAEAKVFHSHSYPITKMFRRYFKTGRFFADNKWFLTNVSLRGYGSGVLKAGVKTLWREKKPHYIPFFLTELTLKVATCKLGWYYQLLVRKK